MKVNQGRIWLKILIMIMFTLSHYVEEGTLFFLTMNFSVILESGENKDKL